MDMVSVYELHVYVNQWGTSWKLSIKRSCAVVYPKGFHWIRCAEELTSRFEARALAANHQGQSWISGKTWLPQSVTSDLQATLSADSGCIATTRGICVHRVESSKYVLCFASAECVYMLVEVVGDVCHPFTNLLTDLLFLVDKLSTDDCVSEYVKTHTLCCTRTFQTSIHFW